MVKLEFVKFLTKQEQLFLAVVVGLLLTGLAVKWYRLAHRAPPATNAVNHTTDAGSQF